MNNQKKHLHEGVDVRQELTPAYKKKKREKIVFVFLVVLAWSAVVIAGLALAEQIMKQESYFEYTTEDVKMLGDVMYAEAGWLYDEVDDHEDVKYALMLTGSALLHRVESRLWGETMKEALNADGQYVWTTLNAIGNIDTPDEVYKWAEVLLRNGPKGPEGLIYASQFEIGEDTYWKLDGKMYFGVMSRVTQKVKGGKIN